jgi:ComF family protein
VHALKYNGNPRLARPLGEMIATVLCRSGLDASAGSSIIVPVPLLRARMVERGYNQAELIARHVARSLRRRGAAPEGPARALKRSGDSVPQTGLTRKERLKNQRGRFAPGRGARRRINGRRVLLIDDVVTTGATVQACVRALVQGGADEVMVAVVARTPAPRGPDPEASVPSRDTRPQGGEIEEVSRS